MPIKGAILIVVSAIIVAILERDTVCEWLESQVKDDDDDIDNNNNLEED